MTQLCALLSGQVQRMQRCTKHSLHSHSGSVAVGGGGRHTDGQGTSRVTRTKELGKGWGAETRAYFVQDLGQGWVVRDRQGETQRGPCLSCQQAWNLSWGQWESWKSLGRIITWFFLYFSKTTLATSKAGVVHLWSPGHCLFLFKRFYWNTGICLCGVYGCFSATVTVLSHWDGCSVASKA